MTRALISSTEGIQRSFAGAVMPRSGSAGQLLSQYSLRLGSTLLRHRAEHAERASRIEAELASKVKSEFIANISHELRTPLNSIIGFSKILKDTGGASLEAAQVGEYSSFIFESASGLLSVINDIILISKIQSGKFELAREILEPDEIASACAHWARGQAESSGRRFVEAIDPATPPFEADPGQIKDVIMRLLRNALTFTGENGRIALIARPAPGGGAIICVSDTGVGMTAEQIDTALVQFGQADHSLDRGHGGTGLGLPIAKAITELHGGELLLHSEPGVGTNVILSFPRATAGRAIAATGSDTG